MLDIDDAEDESSSYSGGSSCKGSGGGREESLVFANSLAKLDMVCGLDEAVCVGNQGLVKRGDPHIGDWTASVSSAFRYVVAWRREGN